MVYASTHPGRTPAFKAIREKRATGLTRNQQLQELERVAEKERGCREAVIARKERRCPNCGTPRHHKDAPCPNCEN